MKAGQSIILLIAVIALLIQSCSQQVKTEKETVEQSQKVMTAKEIFGNPQYQAISYGGYRQNTRDIQPTVEQLKEDMKIMSSMGIKVLRTYNVKLAHASNVLKAISELKAEDPNFEMYVMLGAWIDCLNAWTDLPPDHEQESAENEKEIVRAVALANQYPDIVKVIAVGNEAMVKWAATYFVQPWVILKWVNHLQELKADGKLPADLWVTSSDNFASWGGGSDEYHVDDLNKLIKAVDFISMHTYPMHDTHYNPRFWGVLMEEDTLLKSEKISESMNRALQYSQLQYANVKKYMESLGVNKPVHIGETGWASFSNELYGDEGSKATDEYKEGLYYNLMREWTNQQGISCFYFEAFDEPWKDAANPGGSENYFGLFSVDGQAKYALWPLVDQGVFKDLTRGGNQIVKTFGGDQDSLMQFVKSPPAKAELEIAY
ncbi:MAG: glycosyl hydrolase family 17 [Bacteroidota bacterium]